MKRIAIILLTLLAALGLWWLLAQRPDTAPADTPHSASPAVGERGAADRLPAEAADAPGQGTAAPEQGAAADAPRTRWSLSVQVLRATDDAPVAGAELWLVGPGVTPPRRLLTDDTGNASAADFDHFSYRLEIRAAGFAPVVEELLDLRDSGPFVYRLQSGAGLAGRVVDERNSPVARAQVTALGRFDRNGTPTDETNIMADTQGRFSLLSLRPGSYYLEARSGGHAPAKQGPFNLEPAATIEDIVIQLQPGGRISGRVEGPEGQPIPQARVAAYDAKISAAQLQNGQRQRPVAEGFSGGDGGFELTTLPADGSVTLSAEASGYLRSVKSNIAIGRDDVVLRLAPQGGLELTVQDAETRQPVMIFEGCIALAASRDCPWQTYSNGRMRRNNLGPGTYRAMLRSPRHGAVTVDGLIVVSGETLRKTVALPTATDITGTVVSDNDGSPLANAAVRILEPGDIEYIHASASPYTGGSMGGVRTGEDGRFRLAAAKDQAFQLLATHDEYIGNVQKVSDPAGASDIVLRLKSGGGLKGRITSATGLPLEAVQVMARSQSMMKRSHSNTEGLYELQGLMPGPQRVSVLFRSESGGFSEAEATVLVVAGETRSRDFSEPARGEGVVRGRVLGADGTPLQGYTVHVTIGDISADNLTRDRMYYRNLAAPVWRSSTGSDGGFMVENLPLDTPAVAMLFFNRHIPASPLKENAAAWVAPLVTTTADAPMAEIILQLPTGVMGGTLRDAAGSVVADGEVIASQQGPWGLWSVYGRSNAEGAFRVSPVFDAPMDVQAHHPRAGQAAQTGLSLSESLEISLSPPQPEP